MPPTKSPRKPHSPRRVVAPRESRVLEEIKNRRYVAFLRAIFGVPTKATR
jgi:hypothetical protein